MTMNQSALPVSWAALEEVVLGSRERIHGGSVYMEGAVNVMYQLTTFRS